MKRLFLVSIIVIAIALPGCAKKQKAPVEGSVAPAFTVKGLDGRQLNLGDLKGKVVVLNFWATWCPPCREEIPSMMHLNQAMAGKAFEMVAVSIDDNGKEAVESYFKKTGTSLPAFLDTDQSIGKLYGITGVPETFVIDKKGVILKKIVGAMAWDDPGVIKFLTDAAM